MKVELYPQLHVKYPEHPNRAWAIPLALLVKLLILIPVMVVYLGYLVISVILTLINAFYVLKNGHYKASTYEWNLGVLRYGAKIALFISGVTDRYPGFFPEASDDFQVNISRPERSNKLYATPLLGALIRGILTIPFSIFSIVISYASGLALFGNSFKVLFTGRYSQVSYELVVDSIRLSVARAAYILGMSDNYPSFKISWNHKAIKIALIILAVLVMLMNLSSASRPRHSTYRSYPSMYYNPTSNPITPNY